MKLLREYRMTFERVPIEEPAVDRDLLGLRSKLGGLPDWEQADETPRCPSCDRSMIFVAQIDSIEHDDPGNPHRVDCVSPDQDYMFGDVGMLYVFVCFECLESKSILQCS